MPEDPHVSVRLALAESLADLTTAAHRFVNSPIPACNLGIWEWEVGHPHCGKYH